MKLGLSLFVSGALLRKLLNRFDIDMVDSVMETIYALMSFPRGSSLVSTTYIDTDADSRAKSLGLDVGLLHKLISVSTIENSRKLLDKIYFELARIWMEMKFQAQTKADALSGMYKFRSRDFRIESVMEVDISALEKYFPNDSFSEWQEYLADDDSKHVTQSAKGGEEIWAVARKQDNFIERLKVFS